MNKDLEYYMSIKYPVIINQESDGSYFIKYPDLEGCFSCGDTVEEALAMGEDARALWTEAALEEKIFIPEPREIESCPDNYKLHLPKSLYRQLAMQASKDNTSMNQLCVYLLSIGLSRLSSL